MKRSLRTLLLLASGALALACSGPKPEDLKLKADVERWLAGTDDLSMISISLEQRDLAEVAPVVAPAIVAAWDRVETIELEHSRHLGVKRAQGQDREDCRSCLHFRETLDALAPLSPELAGRWEALRPRLAQAESEAYDVEASDKRPRVLVYVRSSERADPAFLALHCVIDALAAAFPDHKWLPAFEEPGPDAPQIVLAGESVTDQYVDSRTKQEALRVISGLRVTLTPRGLGPGPAARLDGPLTLTASQPPPSEIRKELPGEGAPVVEGMQVGSDQMSALSSRICDDLRTHLATAATP